MVFCLIKKNSLLNCSKSSKMSSLNLSMTEPNLSLMYSFPGQRSSKDRQGNSICKNL